MEVWEDAALNRYLLEEMSLEDVGCLANDSRLFFNGKSDEDGKREGLVRSTKST